MTDKQKKLLSQLSVKLSKTLLEISKFNSQEQHVLDTNLGKQLSQAATNV
jgi:hypothetical protein